MFCRNSYNTNYNDRLGTVEPLTDMGPPGVCAPGRGSGFRDQNLNLASATIPMTTAAMTPPKM